MEKEGTYIYCIIESGASRSFGAIGIGGRGDEVYTVCSHGMAAVVSNSPIKRYPVSREHLLCHQRAVEEAMKTHTVLPVRFATIAEDEEKVKKILEKEHDRFVSLFRTFEDKKELGLKAMFKEDVIYKELVDNHDHIRTLKEHIASLSSGERHYPMVVIGKQVEAALQEEKGICQEAIIRSLAPLSVDMKLNDTYGDMMILNAAFLVERCREEEFDKKVEELSQEYNDKMRFKYVGPVPPCNFVNLVIETGKYANGVFA